MNSHGNVLVEKWLKNGAKSKPILVFAYAVKRISKSIESRVPDLRVW
jgi:hypothetical protein